MSQPWAKRGEESVCDEEKHSQFTMMNEEEERKNVESKIVIRVLEASVTETNGGRGAKLDFNWVWYPAACRCRDHEHYLKSHMKRQKNLESAICTRHTYVLGLLGWSG